MLLSHALRASFKTTADPILTYVTSVGQVINSSTTTTFSNVSLGSNGLLIVSFAGESFSPATPSTSSLTVGGTSATLVVQKTEDRDTDGETFLSLYQVSGITASSANIVVNFSSTQSVLRGQIGIWRIENLSSNTAQATTSTSAASGTGQSATLNSLPSKSVIIAPYMTGGNSGNTTFTGVTENFDEAIAGSTGTRAAGGSIDNQSGNVTVTTSHTNVPDGQILLLAAWR